jgi:hypothetical protein
MLIAQIHFNYFVDPFINTLICTKTNKVIIFVKYFAKWHFEKKPNITAALTSTGHLIVLFSESDYQMRKNLTDPTYHCTVQHISKKFLRST